MDIIFREIDYEEDAEEVVRLLNENLKAGFTVDLLKWKHLFGAFGPSHNVIAVDGNKIVAVVFAMRYNYINGKGERIRGIRTFDGCTDPDYRGKGIFKKLMKACVEKFSMDYDFLMANPNEASYAEHIKLGYEEPKTDYYYKLGIVNPFGENFIDSLQDFEKAPPQENVFNDDIIHKGEKFITGNSLRFLNWRYQPDNYILKKITIDKTDNYISYRRIKKKGISVLILCDFNGNEKLLNKVVHQICRKEKTWLVYFLSNKINNNIKFLAQKTLKRALIVFKFNDFILPQDVVITLGDLEGRL